VMMAKVTKLEGVEGGKVSVKEGVYMKIGVCGERKKVCEVEEVNETELVLETTVMNDDL